MQDNDQVEIIRREVAPVVAQAECMAVESAEQYEAAGGAVIRLATLIKQVNATCDPVCKATDLAHKAATKQRSDLLTPLKRAKDILSGKQTKWHDEQERIRQAEQRRLQAIEDARTETERKRLEAQAARLKTPELREERLEQAAAVVASAVVLAPSAPKVAGQSYRKVWRAQIIDPKVAVMRLMDLPDWQAYITIHQGELDRLAARTKGAVTISGIKFSAETTLASRGA